jgi:hypothetical protein
MSESMYGILQRFVNSRMTPQSIVKRMQIVLLAIDKRNNIQISQAVGLSRQQVGLWRRRWRDSYPALLAIQFCEPSAKFERSIMDVFRDAPRPGAPGEFTAEQVVGILSIACEPPSQSERPVTTWTGRELANEAVKRELVDSISTSQVNRFLAVRQSPTASQQVLVFHHRKRPGGVCSASRDGLSDVSQRSGTLLLREHAYRLS